MKIPNSELGPMYEDEIDFENHTPGRDNLDAPFEKTKELTQKGWEAIKQKYNNVAEIVKLNTFDKRKVLSERTETNKVIAQRMQYVRDLEGRLVTGERNIQYFESVKIAEKAKFEPSIDTISDPHIKEIFVNNLKEKLEEADRQIQHTQAVMGQIRISIENQTTEIEKFQQKIKEAGAAFTERLDSRIEQIRQKHKYEQWQECLTYAHGKVNECLAFIAQTNGKIVEYNGYLATARQLGVKDQDCKTIQAGIAAFHVERQNGIARDAQYRKMFTDSQKRIQEIDAKTAKYENIKRELSAGVVMPSPVTEPASIETDSISDTSQVSVENNLNPAEPVGMELGMSGEDDDIVDIPEVGAENSLNSSEPIGMELGMSDWENEKIEPPVSDVLPVHEEPLEDSTPRVRGQLADDTHPRFVANNPDSDLSARMKLRSELRKGIKPTTEVVPPETRNTNQLDVERLEKEKASKQLGEIMMHIHDTLDTSDTAKIWDDVTKLNKVFNEHRNLFESSQFGKISKGLKLIQQRYSDRDTSPENDARVRQELQRDVNGFINGTLYDWVSEYGGITKKNSKSEGPQVVSTQKDAGEEEIIVEPEPVVVAKEEGHIEELENLDQQIHESRSETGLRLLKEKIAEISKFGTKKNGKIWDNVFELEKILEEYEDICGTDVYPYLRAGFEQIKKDYSRKGLSSSKKPEVRQQFIADVAAKVLEPFKAII